MSRIIPFLGLMVAVMFLLLAAAPAHGQSKVYNERDLEVDCDEPHSGLLTIGSNQHGSVQIELRYCVETKEGPPSPERAAAALGCPAPEIRYSRHEENKLAAVTVLCEVVIPRNGLVFTGQVDLPKLEDVLESAGIQKLGIEILVPGKGVARCDPSPYAMWKIPEGTECTYALNVPFDEEGVPRFWFGYDAGLLARLGTVLGFLLLLPIALTIWLRHRALSTPEDTKAEVCFAYFKFLKWCVVGGGLVWWTAIDLLQADDFVTFVLPAAGPNEAESAGILPWVLLWIPPAVVYFLCLVLSAPIHALRGAKRSRSQMVNQAFWSVARFVVPITLLVLAIDELTVSPRVAVLLFAAGIAGGAIAQRKLAKAYGLELHALTSGELRDRAFTLAEKARAKLNQLYVLPAEHIRMANAFAHAGQNIFLTDYLLKNLSKREVDAIVGHEVAHFQNKHISKRIGLLVIAVMAIVAGTIWAEEWIPTTFPSGPAAYAIVVLIILFVSRRNEFAADAGSVKLTGDTEAMITSLAKVMRLNTMPMHWGKLDEKMLTHPSTSRRIMHLARAGGISEQRIRELLSGSAAPPTDVYSIPATALPAGKIFTTQYKGRLARSTGWILKLLPTAVAGGVALAIQSTHFSSMVRFFGYLSGFLLMIAVQLALSNFLPLFGTSKLGARLREKAEKESAGKIRNGLFVSLSPDSGPRIYEGNWAWDIGLAGVSTDGFFYWGEEAQFALRRDEITKIACGQGPVGWLNTASCYVTWRDASGVEHVFNLRVLQVHSMRQMARSTRQLVRELESWRSGGQLPPGSLVMGDDRRTQDQDAVSLGVPKFGRVTSMSPQKLVRGPFLSGIFLSDTILTVAMAILLGLRFPILDSLAPATGQDDMRATGGGVVYMLCVVWLTRAFQLWPFRHFPKDAPQPARAALEASRATTRES